MKIVARQQGKYKCHLYVPIPISNIICMHLLKPHLNLHQETHIISESLLVYLCINILMHSLSNTQTKVTEMNYFTHHIQTSVLQIFSNYEIYRTSTELSDLGSELHFIHHISYQLWETNTTLFHIHRAKLKNSCFDGVPCQHLVKQYN